MSKIQICFSRRASADPPTTTLGRQPVSRNREQSAVAKLATEARRVAVGAVRKSGVVESGAEKEVLWKRGLSILKRF